MSRRQKQYTSTLQRALSQVLATRLNDPRIVGMVTVTEVEVTPDQRHAKVGVSVMPDKYEQRTLQGLRHASRHIQSLLYKEMRARTIPHLHFELDRSIKKQAEMLDVIRRAVESGEAPPSDADSEADAAQEPRGTASDSSNPAPEDPSK